MREKGFAHFLVLLAVVIIFSGIIGTLIFRNFFNSPQVKPEPKQICAQVMTSAINAGTKECQTYSTPCDVPSGWVAVQSCSIGSPVPTPSVVDTSNWKTYSGAGGSFTFKYPSDWRYDNKNTSSKVFGALHLMTIMEFDQADSKKKDPAGLLLGRIELSYFGSGDFKDKNLDDYISDVFQYGKPENKDVSIGDLKVKMVRHTNCAWGSDCADVVFMHGTTFFDFRLLVQETKEADLQLVYAMIETFKFKDSQ